MRVLIVDDEPLARRGVRVCLKKVGDAEVVGECSSGAEALEKIAELRPDVVFLDVQMPGMDGFAVVEGLDPQLCPLIIFLTAHDAYAIRAFSVHAIDYVLKPIHDDRFLDAVNTARRRLHEQQARAMLGNIKLLLADRVAAASPQGYLEKIAVKTGNRTQFVSMESVDWMEAAGDYVGLHVGRATHLVRETLDGLEHRLDPERFVRIHRSTIVAVKHVKVLHSLPTRDVAVELHDGTELRASRRYRERLYQRLA